MRVDDVNLSKKVGYIKFNSDTEMDLIGESIDRLIAKQQKLVNKMRRPDEEETEKLERFKKSKDAVIEIPKRNRNKLKNIKDKIKDRHKKDKEGRTDRKEEEEDIEDTEEFKNANRVMQDSEAGSGLSEGTEVTHRNIHVLVNALNEHIWDMEKNDLYKRSNEHKQKYTKLQQLLQNAQEQKSKFERQTPKPRGFGRLRK